MTSQTKLDHIAQIIFQMWSSDQSLVTLEFNVREVIIISVYKYLTRKTHIFEKQSWFKFTDIGLVLGRVNKFYNNLEKWLKLKVEML